MSERRAFDESVIAAIDRVLEHWALLERDPDAGRELAAKTEDFEKHLLSFLETTEGQAEEITRQREVAKSTLSKIARFRAKLAGQERPI